MHLLHCGRGKRGLTLATRRAFAQRLRGGLVGVNCPAKPYLVNLCLAAV